MDSILVRLAAVGALLCLPIIGIGGASPVVAQVSGGSTFKMSLRIDDRVSREIEEGIRKVFFDYLLRKNGSHKPSVDVLAIFGSRGSFKNGTIDFPLWADEEKLPSMLKVLQGKRVPSGGCDLSFRNDGIQGRIFFIAFDPDEVDSKFIEDCIAIGYLEALGHDRRSGEDFSSSYELFIELYKSNDVRGAVEDIEVEL